jgi:hypothetical protein
MLKDASYHLDRKENITKLDKLESKFQKKWGINLRNESKRCRHSGR